MTAEMFTFADPDPRAPRGRVESGRPDAALLGHESFATTQRYAHLAPDAHSKVIES